MKLADDQIAELVDAIAHCPIGSGYYSTSIGIDEAHDIADEIAPLIEAWLAEAWDEGYLDEAEHRHVGNPYRRSAAAWPPDPRPLPPPSATASTSWPRP